MRFFIIFFILLFFSCKTTEKENGGDEYSQLEFVEKIDDLNYIFHISRYYSNLNYLNAVKEFKGFRVEDFFSNQNSVPEKYENLIGKNLSFNEMVDLKIELNVNRVIYSYIIKFVNTNILKQHPSITIKRKLANVENFVFMYSKSYKSSEYQSFSTESGAKIFHQIYYITLN